MAFETGTALNLPDFIDKLQTFLTAHPDLVSSGQAWQKLYDVTVPASGTTFESRGLAFKAPGLGGADELFIGINTWGIPRPTGITCVFMAARPLMAR